MDEWIYIYKNGYIYIRTRTKGYLCVICRAAEMSRQRSSVLCSVLSTYIYIYIYICIYMY